MDMGGLSASGQSGVSQGSVRGQSEVSPAEVIDRLVKKIRVFNDTVHIFTNCLSKYLLVF